MSLSTSVHDLKTLVLSFHPVVAIETVEEDRVLSLLRAVADQVWKPLFEWSLTRGLVKTSEGSLIAKTTDPLIMLKHIQGLTVEGIFLLKDFARHLEEAKVARQFREVAQTFTRMRSTMFVTGAAVQLPKEIDQEAVRYDLKLPDRDELLKVVYTVLQSLKADRKIETRLSDEDRENLLYALQGLTLNQARQAVASAVLDDERFTPEDIRFVLKRKAQMVREGGILEYYPLDDNRYELGGFANLKAWLQRAYVGFSPEAQAFNLSPPRGILIVGVPGCGKSLAAKVIAREWKLPLLKLDAGRLFDKYIGESEKNFRKAITLAESMAPVVLWIDEIEKAMVSAGSSEADGGLSRRLFGAFLTWLQEKRQEVFVVATANDLAVLPPRAPPERALRRDLFRGSADERGARGHRQNPLFFAQAGLQEIRSGADRRRVRRVQRCGDRAGGHCRALPGLSTETCPRHGAFARGDSPDDPPVGDLPGRYRAVAGDGPGPLRQRAVSRPNRT